jgi:hypothetical protein
MQQRRPLVQFCHDDIAQMQGPYAAATAVLALLQFPATVAAAATTDAIEAGLI